MKKICKRLFYLFIIFAVGEMSSSAQDLTLQIPASLRTTELINQTGTVNNRSLDSIKQFDIEQKQKKDIKKYKENVQLKGNLRTGVEDETTDVELETEERLPFHLNFMIDNANRHAIGDWRGGVMLQNDNLFRSRSKLTIGTYANPNSILPFVDYNIPINKKGGKLGLSYSYGYSEIGNGEYKKYGIKGHSHNSSLYYYQPIIRKPWMEVASTSSIGYKYATTSFRNTDLYKNKIPYAKTGISFRYDSKQGIWYIEQNVSYAFPFFDDDSNYLKLDGGIIRLHDFGHGVVGQLKANYQVIPKKVVPYVDQYTIGGFSTVRGYSEGLLIGRNAYSASAELMFPILPRTIKSKDKTKEIQFIGHYLKGFVFADHGGVFPYRENKGYNKDDFLFSLGCGLRIYLPKDLYIKLAWGFPVLKNKYEKEKHWGRFHFDLNLSPDFDALLYNRTPKENRIETVKLPLIENVDEESKIPKNINADMYEIEDDL